MDCDSWIRPLGPLFVTGHVALVWLSKLDVGCCPLNLDAASITVTASISNKPLFLIVIRMASWDVIWSLCNLYVFLMLHCMTTWAWTAQHWTFSLYFYYSFPEVESNTLVSITSSVLLKLHAKQPNSSVHIVVEDTVITQHVYGNNRLVPEIKVLQLTHPSQSPPEPGSYFYTWVYYISVTITITYYRIYRILHHCEFK